MRDLRKHLQSITLPVYATFDTYDDNPDEMAQRAPYDVWTISPNPRKPGWETDGACDGYGLPSDTAHAYADLINAVPELLATIDDLTAKLEEAKQREMLYRRVVSAAEDIVWCDRATPLDWGEKRLSEALSALNKEDERPEMTRDEQRR